MPTTNLSEKVSVNINTSTLSSIDLLVDNGYYSNRSDFINQAVRESLQKHQNTLDRIIDSKLTKEKSSSNPWFMGVCSLEQEELEEIKNIGKPINYTGYGVLAINESIDKEMLFTYVKNIKVKGKVICSQDIKKHYGLK